METVWLLWFEQERKDVDDTELLIGVYKSEGDANAAERTSLFTTSPKPSMNA